MAEIKGLIDAAIVRGLTKGEAEQAFLTLFEGAASPAQIAGFLIALRTRGETVTEIAAAASVMRAKMQRVRAPDGAIDIVGTGGDGKGTLNISTATAFVVAGAGVPVAKHGNRKLSSKSGAADALSSLGIDLMQSAEVSEHLLDEHGIAFLMAPLHHAAMHHVSPVRVELGTRTVFNIVGPLTNPAGVKRQLTGAFSREWLRPMAEVLRDLGSDAAWLVHGSDGTDELSIAGLSHVVAFDGGEISEFEVHPEDAGLPVHDFTEVQGGNPIHNARKLSDLLGGEHGGYRDAVLLNAAAALKISGKVEDLKDGVALAADSIDAGHARNKLEALKTACEYLKR